MPPSIRPFVQTALKSSRWRVGRSRLARSGRVAMQRFQSHVPCCRCVRVQLHTCPDISRPGFIARLRSYFLFYLAVAMAPRSWEQFEPAQVEVASGRLEAKQSSENLNSRAVDGYPEASGQAGRRRRRYGATCFNCRAGSEDNDAPQRRLIPRGRLSQFHVFMLHLTS